jgi:hypothetical protein
MKILINYTDLTESLPESMFMLTDFAVRTLVYRAGCTRTVRPYTRTAVHDVRTPRTVQPKPSFVYNIYTSSYNYV